MKNASRASGLLLHPTSLPGPFGIGELGQEVYRFIDWLVEAKQSLWQILPLGATGYGDSPYASFSAFAGNPLLISLQQLQEEGLLTARELEPLRALPAHHVDFGALIPLRTAALRKAFKRWQSQDPNDEEECLRRFRQANGWWLEPFALFMALKEKHKGAPWWQWKPIFKHYQPDLASELSEAHTQTVQFEIFLQFVFHKQWSRVKRYAHERGIQIIGDLPIFVAHDSADVWSHPHLFQMDDHKNLTAVAGVPPDAFSQTGQRWGNPLYDWEAMQADGFQWWIARFQQALRWIDVVRVDHFRGFSAYWSVPANQPTAMIGEWVPAPGHALFEAVTGALGELPLLAEDLGFITEEVEHLRDRFGFWGMKVLQFAFEGGPENPYLPHHHQPNMIVYTGTHDNDTSLGWFQSANADTQEAFYRYIGCKEEPVHRAMIRLAMASVCRWSVVPVQDVLGLGSEARMNLPGAETGWWTWRLLPGALNQVNARWLGELTEVYGRI